MGKGRMNIHNDIIKSDMEDIYQREIDWNKLHNKTVFISGAYGMLASYLVYFLMYLNMHKGIPVDVIAQGRSEEKAREKFGDFWQHEKFHFYSGDICRPLEDIDKVDYVIHAAGSANPRYYKTKPVEVIEPNVLGTYHLLRMISKKKSEGFLFFSTGAADEKAMGIIVDPLEEHSCYGESKRLGETLCMAFYREHQVPVKMARIGHTYGPTMDIENDPRVFASFVKCLVDGEDIVLYSDGSAKRPFCYIADATVAFLLLLLEGRPGEAYNVTNTEQFVSIKELAEILSTIPEKKAKVLFKKRSILDSYLEAKLEPGNRPSDARLRNLGWEPHYDIRSGFERVYRYFSS